MRMAPGAFSVFFFILLYISFQSSFILPSNLPVPYPYLQLYGKGDYFSPISLEWLGILFGFHLLRGSINTAVVAQLLK